MSAGRAAAALALVVAAVAGVRAGVASAAGPVPPPGPTARADRAAARVGELVRVEGTGWGSDVDEVVRVVLCGNNALDGMADCDLTNTAEGGIAADGVFHAAITLRQPILPCSCVLRLSSEPGNATLTLPITVIDAPTAPPLARVSVRRAVAFTHAAVVGRGPWTAWFGGRPSRTLELRLANTGTVPLQGVTLDVRWGRGQSPSGFIDPPQVADLRPGQTTILRVRIPTSALAFGHYTVLAHADPLGAVATADVTYTTYPWGLLFVALAIAGGAAALAARARARGRAPAREVGVSSVARPAPGWYPDPVGMGRLRGWDGAAWLDETRPKPAQREKRRRRRRSPPGSSSTSQGSTGSPVGGGA